MSQQPEGNINEMQEKMSAGELELGGGAQFWAYISPQNNTAQNVTNWKVTLQQQDGNWTGTITSQNPQQILQTPNLSGIFKVTVVGSGPNMPEHQLSPKPGSRPDIGCNSNCAAMVLIVSNADGTDANYQTTWDAICKP